jgi:phage gp45-like
MMRHLAASLDRLVTRATLTTTDTGGTAQMRGLSGGGLTETLPDVSMWALPYFYSVAKTGVRGLVLRLLRGGGIMVAAKHSRPTDAVAGEAGILSPGGILMRLLYTNYFEIKGAVAAAGISLGARDFSDGVPLLVVRTTDPVVTPAGIGVGTCQATTTRVVAA